MAVARRSKIKLECAGMVENYFVDFKKMRSTKELCDIEFEVKQSGTIEKIPAHSVIVAAVMPYIRKKLLESPHSPINLNVDPWVLKVLIDFAYTHTIEFDLKKVTDLLRGAHYLGVTDVEDDCSKFLKSSLDSENVLSVRKLAEDCSCTELVKTADAYVKENLREVSRTKDFLNCRVNYLIKLFGEDDLKENQKLYHAAVEWVKVSPSNRKRSLLGQMSESNIPKQQIKYLEYTLAKGISRETTPVSQNPLLESKRKFSEIVDPILPSQDSVRLFFSPSAVPRRIEYILNRVDQGMRICTLCLKSEIAVQRLDPQHATWITEKVWNFEAPYGTFAQMQNRIYIFGWTDALECDPRTKTARYLSKIPTPRNFAGASSLENKIYVCGGITSQNLASDAMECLDPEENSWKLVTSVPTARWGLNAVTLEKYIYLLGGESNDCYFARVERWNSTEKKWETLSSMFFHRSYAGAAALNGKIYVCGGKTGKEFVKSLELYDPHNGQWTTSALASLRSGRSLFTLLAFDKKLYVIGGKNLEDQVDDVVEIYDPLIDKWFKGPSFIHKVHAAWLVAI